MTDYLVPISALMWDAKAEPGAVVGSPGILRDISINDLVVDQRYQRNILGTGRRTINKILEGFDWAKLQPITVTPCADAPGKYAILDGQHRAVAAALTGTVKSLPCYVLTEMSLAEQARIFRDINATVTKISAQQLHHAGVVAGNPAAVAIDSVCRVAGVAILRHNKARNLMQADECVCVSAIAKSLKKYGFETLRDALTALRLSAEGEGFSNIGARNVVIVCEVIKRRRPVQDDLVHVLKSVDLESLIFDVRQRVATGKAVGGVAAVLCSKLTHIEGAAA